MPMERKQHAKAAYSVGCPSGREDVDNKSDKSRGRNKKETDN